ncbi:hypothetical protein PPL_03495 [Heterostelium album PN500]|uniref:Uncharacterized protein n=1 Tax=Heterostelium pallidum (strain ATCC 26659 / Pp 5 / PN500) TaxID=670386 RepID=D3B518_HETP5|nr:hypothetical protein PPL_03495 [Heterostelium album PN500]EFA83504.1 hypothetical protein PPL_03495 [Heterostelium album PN500]|eukprot:XP_020435621.1 hypothetical protein PPL_03495 [Heterostelium album PN500]
MECKTMTFIEKGKYLYTSKIVESVLQPAHYHYNKEDKRALLIKNGRATEPHELSTLELKNEISKFYCHYQSADKFNGNEDEANRQEYLGLYSNIARFLKYILFSKKNTVNPPAVPQRQHVRAVAQTLQPAVVQVLQPALTQSPQPAFPQSPQPALTQSPQPAFPQSPQPTFDQSPRSAVVQVHHPIGVNELYQLPANNGNTLYSQPMYSNQFDPNTFRLVDHSVYTTNNSLYIAGQLQSQHPQYNSIGTVPVNNSNNTALIQQSPGTTDDFDSSQSSQENYHGVGGSTIVTTPRLPNRQFTFHPYQHTRY